MFHLQDQYLDFQCPNRCLYIGSHLLRDKSIQPNNFSKVTFEQWMCNYTSIEKGEFMFWWILQMTGEGAFQVIKCDIHSHGYGLAR